MKIYRKVPFLTHHLFINMESEKIQTLYWKADQLVKENYMQIIPLQLKITLCLGVQKSYRDLIKLRVRKSINFSKFHLIYQDIFLTPTFLVARKARFILPIFWIVEKFIDCRTRSFIELHQAEWPLFSGHLLTVRGFQH